MDWHTIYPVHFLERQPSKASVPPLTSTRPTNQSQAPASGTEQDTNGNGNDASLGVQSGQSNDIPRDEHIRVVLPLNDPDRVVHVAGASSGTRKNDDPEPDAVIRIGSLPEASIPAADGGVVMDAILVAEVRLPAQSRPEIKIREVESWFINGISIGDWENGSRVGFDRAMQK